MVLLTINKPSDIELIVKRINGFSLMEILVVITIIAVLAVGRWNGCAPASRAARAKVINKSVGKRYKSGTMASCAGSVRPVRKSQNNSFPPGSRNRDNA